MVEEERAHAQAEIGNARAAVQRIEQALNEREKLSEVAEKQVCIVHTFFHQVYAKILLLISNRYLIQYKFEHHKFIFTKGVLTKLRILLTCAYDGLPIMIFLSCLIV